jgi:tRNA1(Val) A37 N6-methylase TrmN6
MEKIYKNEENIVLDCNTGIGFTIHLLLKINPKMKITGFVSNPVHKKLLIKLFPYLLYPNVKIHPEDFINYNLGKNQKYQTIICNPPYPKQKDVKFYKYFVNKCVNIVNNSKTKYPNSEMFLLTHPVFNSKPKNTQSQRQTYRQLTN